MQLQIRPVVKNIEQETKQDKTDNIIPAVGKRGVLQRTLTTRSKD